MRGLKNRRGAFQKSRGSIVLCALALLCCSCGADRTRVFYQYPQDKNMWAHTFGVSEAFLAPAAMPRAIIIPHHDICLFEQNSFYKALSRFKNPPVVVILSPDHFERGTAAITVPTHTTFYAPDGSHKGKIRLAQKELSALKKNKALSTAVSFQDGLWEEEHGVFAHTPFIHHYFPTARLLPILLKPCATETDFDAFMRLADFLAQTLPKDALIVASVDFSHYQIPRMTSLHDEVSLNTIFNAEDVKNIEVDSPESLFVLHEYCARRGASERVLLHRTCTFDKIPDEGIESTSHQYWAFYDSDAHNIIEDFYKTVPPSTQRIERRDYQHTRNCTLILGGSGDIGAGVRTAWHWDRYNTSRDRADILLRDVAGKEARFLSGFDAYIFDVPEDEHVALTKHGTVLKIESVPFKESALYADVLPTQEKNPQEIDIAVILCKNQHESVLEAPLAEKLLSFYDVVLCRYNAATDDSFAYFKSGSAVHCCNLGVMVNEGGAVQGALLALNWKNDELFYEVFEYQSDGGIIPAISQFPVQEE